MTAASLKAAATGQATPQQARSPYEALKRQLESNKPEFRPLLGTDANVDKFVRVVLNSVLANPELIEADFRTLVTACMKSAQDGLMPDGREAVLNIYNTKVSRGGRDEWIKCVQYLPMVGGLIKKLYESGEVTYVDAAAVYANDKFTFRRGDDPKLEHEPTLADDAGIIVAAYVVIKLKSGEIKREVMPRRDIEAVRAASKSGDAVNGPWKKWYDQQAIKSVIKRVYKQLPKTDALEHLIANDNEALGFAAISPMDLVNRPAAATGAPAITHQPVEPLFEDASAGMFVHQQQGETVSVKSNPDDPSVGAEVGKKAVDTIVDDVMTDAAKRNVGASNAKAKAEAKPPTEAVKRASYAVLAEQMNKAKDRDAADLILDEARHLPADQMTDLLALADKKFPRG